MEPLSSADRAAMKANGRSVTDAEIDEYEALLLRRIHAENHAERELAHGEHPDDARIEELYEKLYNTTLPRGAAAD